MSQHFPDGTLITRRPDRYNDWWSSWCRHNNQPLDGVFQVEGWHIVREGLSKGAAAPDLSLFIPITLPSQSIEDYA